MELFYDPRDRVAARHGDQRLRWLYELKARPLEEAHAEEEGFLFTGARRIEDYRELVRRLPRLRDRPDEREPLLELDQVLDRLRERRVEIPTPKTWKIALDQPIPRDLPFPLFVRTTRSSWKLGGTISKVRDRAELEAEMQELRRAIQWDAPILAREWVDLTPAGSGVYGRVPQEVRCWIVDGEPFAWSFHYLQLIAAPAGFPPKDLGTLRTLASRLAGAFHSRCVAADFAKRRGGGWIFIEAGPGSAAGTAHEGVFKAVARRLREESPPLTGDAVGGLFQAGDV